MVHSDWGTWFVDRIADADPDGVAVWYLGCNGFVLKDGAGTTLFIDPYCGTGDPPRTTRMLPVPFDPEDVHAADAVLSTHEHTDHAHGPTVGPILADTGADFYGPDSSITAAQDWPERWNCTAEQLTTVVEGDTFDIGAFTITVEPSYDPDADHPVTYVVEHEAGTFFHAGDSKPCDDFERIGEAYDIDCGVLAFGCRGRIGDGDGGMREVKWYADENEVAEMATDLQLDRLVPSHWDIWRGLTTFPDTIRPHVASYPYPQRLDIVEIGDRFDL
jgi:L-ascorbate 6-phosphate lactonase